MSRPRNCPDIEDGSEHSGSSSSFQVLYFALIGGGTRAVPTPLTIGAGTRGSPYSPYGLHRFGERIPMGDWGLAPAVLVILLNRHVPASLLGH